MKLTIDCNGTFISVNQISQLISAAGSNTTISISDAQGRPQAELIPVIKSAKNKKLAIDIDAAKASINQTLALINATSDPNTSYSIRNINSFSAQQMDSVFSAIGNRLLSTQFDGASGSQNQAIHYINSSSGGNTSLSISSFSSLTSSAVTAVLNAVGSKKFSAQILGAQTSQSQILSILNQAVGANTLVSLTDAQSLTLSFAKQVFSAVGSRTFNPDFNATATNVASLKQLVTAAGSGTSISVNTAQAFSSTELASILATAGQKKISLNMNGAQLGSGQLLSAVQAASSNTYLTVNTAQATNLNDMLSSISASGNTNFSAQYNGAQLVVTPTDGNHVVRAIQVAKPTTNIILNSVGTAQFNLNIILDIINAAK